MLQNFWEGQFANLLHSTEIDEVVFYKLKWLNCEVILLEAEINLNLVILVRNSPIASL